MSWLIADLKSFLPLEQSSVQPVPTMGNPAPSLKGTIEYPLQDGSPSVLVFVRHLGCPFCQQTIQEQLYPLAREHTDIKFFLIPQADPTTTTEYLAKLPIESPIPAPFTLLPSLPPHTLYSTYGISQLSLTNILSLSTISSVMTLAKEKGIKNTDTVGSRWLNSGAFAMDGQGIVKWSHVAKSAEDVSDLHQAVKSLGK